MPGELGGGVRPPIPARRARWLLAVAGCCAITGMAVRGSAAKLPNGSTDAVSIADYGAAADGGADSTGAIEAAISAGRARALPVFVPAGTFRHKAFTLDGVRLFGMGAASVLIAPNPEDATIRLRGSGPSLSDVTVKVASSHRDAQHFAINVDGARHFAIESVTVEGGNAGGIMDFGGSDGTIEGNLVQDTLADAIHNTYGAHDIVIAHNTVRRAGDDMIAVVSYGNEPMSHDILITDNDLADQERGRGISVVGGQNVTIEGNTVTRTKCCAGIYLASEGSWHTAGVDNILVRGNVLKDNGGPTHHGAIMLFADNGWVRNAAVENNTIIGAHDAAVTLIGAVANVSIVGNQFVQPGTGSISGLGSNVFCADNMLDGHPLTVTACTAQQRPVATGAALHLAR